MQWSHWLIIEDKNVDKFDEIPRLEYGLCSHTDKIKIICTPNVFTYEWRYLYHQARDHRIVMLAESEGMPVVWQHNARLYFHEGLITNSKGPYLFCCLVAKALSCCECFLHYYAWLGIGRLNFTSSPLGSTPTSLSMYAASSPSYASELWSYSFPHPSRLHLYTADVFSGNKHLGQRKNLLIKSKFLSHLLVKSDFTSEGVAIIMFFIHHHHTWASFPGDTCIIADIPLPQAIY